MSPAAVFLDRDGVLNEAHVGSDGVARPPSSYAELKIVPDAPAALARLHEAGFLLVVVTNQPDVARGTLTHADVEAMHARLASHLPLDRVEWCPHDRDDGCECRKPRPGMIVRAASTLGIDLAQSWLIGDRWVDIAAAQAAGVRAILVDRPWSWEETHSGIPPIDLVPDARVADLNSAVELVLTAPLHS